jgi:hypothetical protein
VQALMVTVVDALPTSLEQLFPRTAAPAVPGKPATAALGTANAATKAIATGNLRTHPPTAFLTGRTIRLSNGSYPNSGSANQHHMGGGGHH